MADPEANQSRRLILASIYEGGAESDGPFPPVSQGEDASLSVFFSWIPRSLELLRMLIATARKREQNIHIIEIETDGDFD